MSTGVPQADLDALKATLDEESRVREKVFPLARAASEHAEQAVHAFHCGEYEDGLGELAKSMAQLHLTLDAVDDAPNSHYLRGHPAISDAFEKCVSAEYFASFLTTGTLADRSSFRRLTDEEYLCGVISLYDKTREDVIKRTRDVQKLGKQAIFSLHRGDLA